jgi:UDP-glucose 4-epimerase
LCTLSKSFVEFASGSKPTIIWAAGADGVERSSKSQLTELESFKDFALAISAVEPLHDARVVICSSAGGVFSGASDPPFSADSPVSAINDYGRKKIAIEELAGATLSSHFSLHLARITNLYGPWSGPRQGLINRLCTAAATRKALQIYVPLETVRDYIYVDDAARLIFMELAKVDAAGRNGYLSISIIGSGENSSVGNVISTVARVTRRKVPFTVAQLEDTKLQPRDLRMNPSWVKQNLDFSPVSLPNGIKRLFDSLVTDTRWK